MNLAALILKMAGWKIELTVPDFPKCIICVAPHTSNWDFILGKLAYAAVGRHAGFLMKEAWFFFPLGLIFKAIGGIPVPRKRGGVSLVDYVTARFNASQRMAVAITPEGTRSRVTRWHTGFLHIAENARVPIVLGVLDFGHKIIRLTDTFTPTGNDEADMRAIKNYYRGVEGKHPEKFTVDD